MRKRWLMLPVGFLGMVIVSFLGGQIVKLLWNALLPALFGLPAITFWQALGLLVLCRILFGGFGLHNGGSHYRRRWEAMTPEERERIRERMRTRRQRWGFGTPSSEGHEP